MSTNPNPFTGPALPWQASDNGLLGATGQPEEYRDSNLSTAGTVYLVKLPVRQPTLITNLLFMLSTAGAGASTGSFAGLYAPSGGAPLSGSADIGAPLIGATGIITVPLTTPQTVAGGSGPASWPWAAFLENLATTQATMGGSAAPKALSNAGLSAANFRVAVNGTVLTALPSIVPSANVSSGAFALWAGWS